MSKSLKRVRGVLDASGIPVKIRETGDSRTAAQAAAEVGCAPDQIAKSIVFARADAPEALVLFITAGGRQVDLARAAALASGPLGRADGATVRKITGFAIGGVSPIGHISPSPVFFDPTLLEFETVWAAAGTPRHVFEIAHARLVELCQAQVEPFSILFA